jgi:hypothetical protein
MDYIQDRLKSVSIISNKKKLPQTIIIIGFIFLFAILILNTLVLRRRVKQKTQHLQKKEELASELKTISELIPICSNCKSIRDDNGYWE